MTEQNRQDLSQEVVQTLKNKAEKSKKKRSQSQKVGTNKYDQQLIKRCLVGIEDIKTELRWARVERERTSESKYSPERIEYHSKMDDVDKEIVQRLFEVGVNGALPKDVAAEVNKRNGYNLEYYEVSRRLVRLNKKMHFETGKTLFEKHGHRWAMNRLGFESYGAGDVEALSNVDSLVFNNRGEG